ncbi:MAG: hypothetical protein ABIG28_01975 [archaeon]
MMSVGDRELERAKKLGFPDLVGVGLENPRTGEYLGTVTRANLGFDGREFLIDGVASCPHNVDNLGHDYGVVKTREKVV